MNETALECVVDVAAGHLSERVSRIIDACWHFVMAAVLGLLGYLVLRNGMALDAQGRRTELLGLSPLIGHTAAAVGLGIATLTALAAATGILTRCGRAENEERGIEP
jgi:hypothetical protein